MKLMELRPLTGSDNIIVEAGYWAATSIQRNVDAGVQRHGLIVRNEPALYHTHRVHRDALVLPALIILPLNESVVPIRSWAPWQHWAKGRVNSHDFNLNIKRFRSCQVGGGLEILKTLA